MRADEESMEFRYPVGKIFSGDEHTVRGAYEKFHAQAVDDVRLCNGPTGYSERRTGIAREASVTGPGTFYGHAQRTVTFAPSKLSEYGWWIQRADLLSLIHI